MPGPTRARHRALAVLCLCAAPFAVVLAAQQTPEGFRFKSAVELINVTVTVADRTGRFVPGLQKDDFRVYEDEQPQNITHFDNERVPVSLGIALDTSGSMAGDKIEEARRALDRFLYDLLDADDEVFLYRIAEPPQLLERWTTDRRRLSRALSGVRPQGGTAMYDAVAEAVPIAQDGTRRKKALLVISDGNDTSSQIRIGELKQLIRETEVLVYAIGIDGQGEPTMSGPMTPRVPMPLPIPIPGRGRGGSPWPGSPRQPGGYPGGGYPGRGGSSAWGRGDEHVNVGALRQMTDDSGGRTEVIRTAYDLEPATTSIADELSKQYYLGYPSRDLKDGRWHTIRVEVRGQYYTVRARRGYVATP